MQAKIKRRAALIVIAIFVFALFLSCDFLLANAEHDCASCYDCPVCAVLELAREVSGAKRKAASAGFTLAAAIFAVLAALFVKKCLFVFANPVSRCDVLTI